MAAIALSLFAPLLSFPAFTPAQDASAPRPADAPVPTPQEKPALTVEQRLDALEKAAYWRLDSPDNFRVWWKDGLRLTSNDKKIELRIGARLQFEGEWNQAENDLESTRRYNGNSGDASAANTAAVGPLEDGWQVRRARLNFAGNLYEHVEFVLQVDFAKGATQEKDVYAGLYDLGDWIPNVRAGHQYEPFGLDAITSDFESTFIERALPSTTFAPSRNPGVLLWKNLKVANEERLTWAAGAFREDSNDNGTSSGDGAYAITARLTGTPFWQEKGKRMLHVGVDATRRSIAGRKGSEAVTYSSKPECDLLNTFLSTGAMKAAEVDERLGAETAFVWDAFSVQGEYTVTRTNMAGSSALDDPQFSGWYVQAAWTITGENRRWKPADATFQSPRPSANAFDGGIGAWEVAARFSTLDLTDGHKATGGVQGGQLDAATLALNWYLNPNTKLMLDVTHTKLDTDDPALGKGGDANILQMRVQFAF